MQKSIVLSQTRIMDRSDDLIPIDEVIRRGRGAGLHFGFGDPKIHLAYLTRIRLIPQTQRRKIGNKIVGCYPENVIQKLREIEEMKARGMMYSQVRRELDGAAYQVKPETFSLDRPSNPYVITSSLPIAFLVIGLLLGYLLAINNRFNPDGQRFSGLESVTGIPTSGNMPVVTTSRVSTDTEPIYVIAVPRGNLEKLGSTKINLSY